MDEEDWLRDLLCLLVACLVHGALISSPLRPWGAAPKAPQRAIPVDFVDSLPPALPPAGVSAGEKLSAAPKEPPGPRAIAKPRAPAPKRQRAPKRMTARKRSAAETAMIMARRQAAREARAALAAQRLERRRELARLRSEERARRARQRAEIAQELGVLAQTDEQLTDAPNDPPVKGEADSAGGEGKAAGLAEEAEPVYEAGEGGGGLGRSGGSGDLSWSLEGPAGGRRILRRVLPSSPDWLSRRGLELSVVIKFQVLANGAVGEGVIHKTSGFPEVDRRALEALRAWRFAASRSSETWGKVRFRFLMG